jgi:homogentisate 1,2-dioxygenase
VNNSRFKPAEGIDPARFGASADPANSELTPNQLRWQPSPLPEQPVDFVHGLTTICMSGTYVGAKHTIVMIHIYSCFVEAC